MKALLPWKLNPNDPCTMPVRKRIVSHKSWVGTSGQATIETLYQILCLRIRSREEIATIDRGLSSNVDASPGSTN